MLGKEVDIVLKLQECEIDKAEQVRPDVDCLVGEDECTTCKRE